MRRPGWLTRDYLTIDPRSLGAGRIALGLCLLFDLARRVPILTLWYSNLGLLPNHTVLWRPPFPQTFSLFFMASLPYEAAIGFLLCAVAYLMLIVGNRTQWAHLASLLALLSLHGRVLFIQNGGDVVLVELTVWTLFLPTGRRYSLDSLRARLAAHPDRTVEDLGTWQGAPPDDSPVVSLAVLALVTQLAVIYLLNALQKSGPTWREGSAVHYTLFSEGVVTKLGLWVRGWLTPAASRLFTWSALAIESILPLLILSPIARRPARRLAIALVIALHVGFASVLNLGVFVPAMIAFTPFLVPAADWDALERRWRNCRRARGTPQDSLRRRILGALARLEGQGLLRLRPSSDRPAPWRETLRAHAGPLREWAVGFLIICATVRMLVDNPAVTHINAEHQPPVVAETTTYLQMLQAWLLFAPDAPLTDAAVAVDAVTADGRHVDPLNEALSPNHPWLGTTIPPRLGQNAFAAAYMLRIPFHEEYFSALADWLLRYPDRTRRAADRIVSFEVVAIEHDNPPPGQHQPTDTRTRLLFKYPE